MEHIGSLVHIAEHGHGQIIEISQDGSVLVAFVRGCGWFSLSDCRRTA